MLSACIGKSPLTLEVAKRIVKQASVPLHHYRCPFCEQYHVANSKGPRRKPLTKIFKKGLDE